MARSLRSGVNCLCSSSFCFRTDVFTYLFGGKGRECPHKLGAFYDLCMILMLFIFPQTGLVVMIG